MTHLTAIIYAQSRFVLWNNGELEPKVRYSESLPLARKLRDDELQPEAVSPLIRASDIPRGLLANVSEPHLASWFHSQAGDLGRFVQYQFSDGTVLSASEILRHPYSMLLPRVLWPLLANIPDELRGDHSFAIEGVRGSQARPGWYKEVERVLFGVLLHASRLQMREEWKVFFTDSEDASIERRAFQVTGIEFGSDSSAHWVLRTANSQSRLGESGTANLGLEFHSGENPVFRTRHFSIDPHTQKLRFHTLWEQFNKVRSMLARPEVGSTDTDEQATVELKGHALIQVAVAEVNTLLDPGGRPSVEIKPGTFEIPSSDVSGRVFARADGTFQIITHVKAPWGSLELAGLTPASGYLLWSLMKGIGATTGLANSQIAYKRRGLKRDRDMKVLKHLGFGALIFFEAANFAFGLPLSDGTKPESIDELLKSLYARLGSLILKSEGWPVQVGSLEALCSTNITNLIEGFVKQVIKDCEETQNRFYLPEGEVIINGLSRKFVALFHALVADLAHATSGNVFERARTKFFDDFLAAAPLPKRDEEDSVVLELPELAVFRAPSENPLAQAFTSSERSPIYYLPESSRPPKGTHLFGLSEHGWIVFYDGQAIESLNIEDFKPEFDLVEDSPVITNDTRHIDWFELHPKFFFKGIEIPPEQAARLSRDGLLEFQGKIYRLKPQDLPSVERLQAFWDKIQSSQVKGPGRKQKRKPGDVYYQLPKSQTLELLALRNAGVKVSGGPRWKQICAFYDQLDGTREAPAVPASFQAELKGYQKVGVNWLKDLHDLGLGGILADDMGLGKTVTTLAFLELLRAQKKMGPCLVVVPTSLTFNWLSETEKFAPGIPITIFQSRANEASLEFIKQNPDCIVVATYGLLHENIGWFGQTGWNVVVFDEAQNLKNISAKRTTAARQLRGAFKVCLTGTPLENHYGEFYSLFDLVLPGGLGDLADFRDKYVNPPALLRDDIKYLRLKTKPCVLRRTKSQVMQELPPKLESTVKLPFEPEQQRIYRDIATSYNEQIKSVISAQGEGRSQLQMLTALLRLRQVCSDPSSVPNVRYTGEPPKITVLTEALAGIVESGESALVFTQFLATFYRIRDTLVANGIKVFEINGSDSRQVREKRLQLFRDEPGGAVMLMTLKTGGVGLNLTKASYVFHIEPWWNPAVENQATDRAHRIGQEKSVQVYRYIIRESVEEKIELLKEIKGQRFAALFSSSENEAELSPTNSHLTQSDFEYLLS